MSKIFGFMLGKLIFSVEILIKYELSTIKKVKLQNPKVPNKSNKNVKRCPLSMLYLNKRRLSINSNTPSICQIVGLYSGCNSKYQVQIVITINNTSGINFNNFIVLNRI
jgi:hypothetical protein